MLIQIKAEASTQSKTFTRLGFLHFSLWFSQDAGLATC